MNPAPIPADPLDRLLNEYFTARLPRPWPGAPVPTALQAGPAGTPRVHTIVRPDASPGRTNASARSRLTLAASVAVLLGVCWYATSGGPIAERGAPRPAHGGGPNVFPDGTAHLPGEFDKLNRDKAKTTADPMTGFRPKAIPLP